jgi:hypothetical protein
MKYRKKPVVIEAVQYTGSDANKIKLHHFMGFNYYFDDDNNLIIKTLEGDMRASLGDYIIKGVYGEFYPCKPDIFEKTYEVVTE